MKKTLFSFATCMFAFLSLLKASFLLSVGTDLSFYNNIPLFIFNKHYKTVELTYRLKDNDELIRRVIVPEQTMYFGGAQNVQNKFAYKLLTDENADRVFSFEISHQINFITNQLKVFLNKNSLKAFIDEQIKQEPSIDVQKHIETKLQQIKKSVIGVQINSPLFLPPHFSVLDFDLPGYKIFSIYMLRPRLQDELPENFMEKLLLLFPAIEDRALIDRYDYFRVCSNKNDLPFHLAAYILGLPLNNLSELEIETAARDLINLWQAISKQHHAHNFDQLRTNIDEIIDIIRNARQVLIDNLMK